jgi:ribonuclease BN (tRNA processing enzyme)
MAKIIFLGTASSIPTKNRDNTSFLFIHKDNFFLIDCPGSITQKLLKADINYKKLKNIIITHQHPDHIYGIISLIHTQCYFNDRLNIFSNIDVIKIIKKLVVMFKLNKKDYPKINYINVFNKKIFYNKGNLKILAIKNKHIKNSFGLKFIFGKKSVFFTSDTSFSKKLLDSVGKVDYIISDCTASSIFFKKYPSLYKMHTDSNTLANYMKDKKDTKLIPIHFLLLDSTELKRIKNELKILNKNLIIPKDFQNIYIN